MMCNWSDEAYKRTKKATGKAGSETIAEIEIDSFEGFSYELFPDGNYGGRLDIVGHGETIWMLSQQWGVEVVD